VVAQNKVPDHFFFRLYSMLYVVATCCHEQQVRGSHLACYLTSSNVDITCVRRYGVAP
jgi:hypothetical protein